MNLPMILRAPRTRLAGAAGFVAREGVGEPLGLEDVVETSHLHRHAGHGAGLRSAEEIGEAHAFSAHVAEEREPTYPEERAQLAHVATSPSNKY